MFELLKSFPLFEGIEDHELRVISPWIKAETYEKGTWLFREGDKSQAFYLIKSGSVGIFKKERASGRTHRVGALGEHEGFGDSVFLGEERRTSSIQALERLEVLVIPIDAFSKQAETYAIFSELSLNFARQVSRRLHKTNEVVAELMEREFSLLTAHDQMGRLLIHLFVLLTLFFYTVRVIDQFHIAPQTSHWLAAILITGFGLVSCLIVKQSGYPLEFYGVTLKNGWRHIKESVVFTLPVMAVLLVVKAAFLHFTPYFKDLPLIGVSTRHSEFLLGFWHHAKPLEVTQHFWAFFALYLLLIPAQEFIVRGCLQGCLSNFFRSSHRAFCSIVASNLLFALFHGFKSLSFSLSACVLGLFWGWLYHRQRSLVGVSVSHILIGAWAFGLLNFQSILIF